MPRRSNAKFEKAFVKWLNEQDSQVREAISFNRPDRKNAFTIRHGGIILQGAIARRSIDIFAERDGRCWDILLSLAVAPGKTRGGYHCLCCFRRERKVFPDIEGLWRNHLFGPLLGWMRRRLFRADSLCFYSSPGATWVRLLRSEDDPGSAVAIIHA